MAVRTKMGGFGTHEHAQGKPKMTRQGAGSNTKVNATSRNGKRKAYRGQGR